MRHRRSGQCPEENGRETTVSLRESAVSLPCFRRRRIQSDKPIMAANHCSRWGSIASLLYAAILAGVCVQRGYADIECYVCSFNPYEVVLDGANNETTQEPEWWQLGNDTCSWERFDPTRTRTAGCDRGCEIVKMTDGNGELEMFYRNCLTRPDVTYNFVKTRNRLNEEEVFTCDSRLCNGSLSVRSEAAWIILSIAVVLHSRTRS